MAVSYNASVTRVVLDATGVITPTASYSGRVVLNVTDRGRKVSVTVQDTATGSRGRALARLDAQTLRSTALVAGTPGAYATLNAFVR